MEKKCIKFFGILSAAFFLLLLYMSLKGTYISIDLNEKLTYVSDFLPWHILFLFIMIAFLAFFSRYFHKTGSRNILAVTLLLELICGYFWVRNAHTMPQVDQKYIVEIADAFNRGDFGSFNKGGYVAQYPYQIGIITFLRVFFKIFGEKNSGAFEYFNVLMVCLIVFSGYEITGFLSDGEDVQKIYCVLAFLMFPLCFYTPFVYGELMSTALGMAGLWLLMSVARSFSKTKCIASALLLGWSILIRSAFMIVLIAAVIVLLIRFIARRSKESIVLAASLICGTLILQAALNVCYMKYKTADSTSIPISVHVAMGITDNDLGPGWNSGYELKTFADSGYDPAVADQAAKQLIGERLVFFRENPKAAFTFFYSKLNTQWNDPMYLSLAMNNYFWDAPEDTDYEVYFGSQHENVVALMNYLQSFFYFCMFLFAVYCIRRKEQIDMLLIPLAIFGDGVFSLLYEAKSRYVFSFCVLMLPCAAVMAEKLTSVMDRKDNTVTEEKANG